MAYVLLGMSGGVDSTVSAALLKSQGHRVKGVFFVMNETHLSQLPEAEHAAADCGIELEVRDLRPQFSEKVSSPFVSEYIAGRTPNPCVSCNRYIKFPYLLEAADAEGADFIATGHYASVREKGGAYYICRGRDIAKDQSYFLYTLGQDILSRLILPLSGFTKNEVREYALSHGISAASKRDSQDICFIPDGDSAGYVSGHSDYCPEAGLFTGYDGYVFGQHRGIFGYTVGQRRGLGIAWKEPLYVQSIIPSENRVILGTEKELYRSRVRLENCIFADGTVPASGFTAEVCLRYSKKCAPARIETDGNNALLIFETPQRAPAPGQSAVFYEGDRVIGGGIITGSEI